MNEKIDLTKILKDCPKGTKLYSIAYGDVEFEKITGSKVYPILIRIDEYHTASFPADGRICANYNGECTLFPSKKQRDWSKFTASWLKKERFNPKTLQPFDKVLVRDYNSCDWRCAFYSHQRETEESNLFRYATTTSSYVYCIPYNEDTKHLLGTKEEAPEFYRYWEN